MVLSVKFVVHRATTESVAKEVGADSGMRDTWSQIYELQAATRTSGGTSGGRHRQG